MQRPPGVLSVYSLDRGLRPGAVRIQEVPRIGNTRILLTRHVIPLCQRIHMIWIKAVGSSACPPSTTERNNESTPSSEQPDIARHTEYGEMPSRRRLLSMSEFAIAPAAILIVEHRQVMSHWAPCDGRSLTEC